MSSFGLKVIAVLYHYTLQPIFKPLARWDSYLRCRVLNMCRNGCEKCWAWKCVARRTGETPFKKFRRGVMK